MFVVGAVGLLLHIHQNVYVRLYVSGEVDSGRQRFVWQLSAEAGDRLRRLVLTQVE